MAGLCCYVGEPFVLAAVRGDSVREDLGTHVSFFSFEATPLEGENLAKIAQL